MNMEASHHTEPITAPKLLTRAAGHMADRAASYDKPEGERSMLQTVRVFEAFHGIKLTEAQGWHFMQILKDVRLFTREGYHADSAEDCVAYAALKAEAKARENPVPAASASRFPILSAHANDNALDVRPYTGRKLTAMQNGACQSVDVAILCQQCLDAGSPSCRELTRG